LLEPFCQVSWNQAVNCHPCLIRFRRSLLGSGDGRSPGLLVRARFDHAASDLHVPVFISLVLSADPRCSPWFPLSLARLFHGLNALPARAYVLGLLSLPG